MKVSFRWKVVAVFLLGILLSMLCLTFLSSVLLRPIFIHNSKNTMVSYSQKIDKNIDEDKEQINALLEEINVSYGITTYITDKDGNTLFSYLKTSNGPVAEKYKRYVDLYNKKDINENYYFSERIDENDNIKKIIFVGMTTDRKFVIMNKSIKGVDQDIRLISIFIMIMGITVAVIGTAVWSIFTKSFTDNIKKMSVITKKMSQLDFDEKINHKSNDEIGLLADSIDTLSDELRLSIEDLKADVERRKTLIRDISHELKTPVTTVKGYIENIQYIIGEDKKLKRYCEIAAEECDTIDSLIEEMLEMSLLESDGYMCDMERTDALEIFTSMNSKLDTEFRSHKFDSEFDRAEILCNNILISRAVLNFIKNATKHGEKESEIRIRGTLSGNRYYFKVTNKGKPLSEEEKENIWIPFYKNDKSRTRNSSHGIGLAMVRQIAKIHGGDVGLESKDGKNTFFFWLPVIQ